MTDFALHEEEYHGSEFDFALWKRIMQHARPYRRHLAGLGLSGLGVAAVDVMLPVATGWMIDEATQNGATSRLFMLGVFYFALVLILVGFIWWFIVLAGETATGIAYDIRQRAFARLQALPFAYFDERPVGWLMARLTSDCSRLSSLIPWFALDIVWGSCLIFGITGMMFWLNWRLALVVLIIVPPLVVISAIYQKKLLGSSRAIRKANSNLTAGFNEGIMGVRTTKALVREPRNLEEFQSLSQTMYTHSIRNALQSAAYLPIVIAIGSAGVGLALWRGGIEFNNGMTLGTLVAFMQYAALFYMPIQELAARFTQLQTAQASAERVQGLLDTEPAIRDSDAVVAAIRTHASSDQRDNPALAEDGRPNRIERLQFKDVSFAYKEGEPVLTSFNLTVDSGQTIALVGATGGGKSTIVSLLCRFYEPTEGEIRFDGVDYRERSLHWLQSNLGIVLQQPHLFSGTIRENIRYGRLDATDAEIEDAAKLVNAHDFIEASSDGYDTEVGEGGNRLSTGQKQLIALARAVLADPQIFVMDEATSSVDTETEKLIQDGIDTVMQGRTSFIIAHRLSTIRSADLILVIDQGQVIEQGNHDALIAARGRYFELYTNQYKHEQQERELEKGDSEG